MSVNYSEKYLKDKAVRKAREKEEMLKEEFCGNVFSYGLDPSFFRQGCTDSKGNVYELIGFSDIDGMCKLQPLSAIFGVAKEDVPEYYKFDFITVTNMMLSYLKDPDNIISKTERIQKKSRLYRARRAFKNKILDDQSFINLQAMEAECTLYRRGCLDSKGNFFELIGINEMHQCVLEDLSQKVVYGSTFVCKTLDETKEMMLRFCKEEEDDTAVPFIEQLSLDELSLYGFEQQMALF